MPSGIRFSRTVATVALALLVALVAAPSLAMAVVGPIQGTITNSAASPLSGVHVVVQGVTPTAAHWAEFTTGPDGMYTFAVPESGDYSVTAEDPASVYLTDTHLVSNVTTDTTVTSDFTLLRPGGISGTATDAMSSAPVQLIEVQSVRLGGDFEYWDGTDLTDQYGRYSIAGANPGPHAVFFNDGVSGRAVPYAPQWYSGATLFSAATTVTVTEDAVTPNINALLSSDTVLGGRVTDATTGIPLGTTIITIQNDNTADLAWLITSADGTYRIAGLPAGTYTVSALSPEDDYINFSQGVTLADNQVLTNVDFAMSPVAAGYMTGRAVNGATAPLPGIEVRLSNGLPGDWMPVVFSTTTAADGTFSLPPRTGDITLTFFDPTGAHPTMVTTLVAAGAGPLGDFVLGAAGTVSGTTVDASGTPLAGVAIRLYDAADGVTPLDSALSGLDGSYSFGDLPAGNYRLAFDADGYASEFFDNAATFGGATNVVLAAGGAETANAMLSPPGTIAGTVTDVANVPSVGTIVQLWHVGPNGLEPAGMMPTDGTGSFSIGSLVSGDYLISLTGGLGSGYVAPGGQWLTSSTDLAARFNIPDSLTPVTINTAVRYAFDANAPTVSISLASASTFGSWRSSPTTVTLTATDAESGIADIFYTIDGGSTQTYTGPFAITSDGMHTVSYWATDNVGNASTPQDQAVNIDAVAPDVSITVESVAISGTWHSSPATVTLSATDSESGVASISYQIDGGPTQTYTGPFAIIADGPHTVTYWAIDNVGNETSHLDQAVNVDAAAPSVSATVEAAHSYGDWYSSPATVTITATDEAFGVDSVSYQIDGGPALTYTGPFAITSEGPHTVTYWAIDTLGNESVHATLAVNIDSTPPDVAATVNGTSIGGVYPATTVTIEATDGGSGVANIYYTLDGGATTTYSGSPIPVNTTGAHTVVYWAVDNVANESTHKPLDLTVDASAPTMPGNLHWTALHTTSVSLAWSPSTDVDFDHYEVAIDGTVVTSTTDTVYTTSGLNPGTTYHFTVTAIDALGNRSTPAELDVTTPASTLVRPVGTGPQTVVFHNVPFMDAVKDFVFKFDFVQTAGNMFLTPLGSDVALEAPTGLRTIGGFYDVEFEGKFNGSVLVTMPYDSRLPDFRAQNMVLVHWVGGVPEVLDTTVNTSTHNVTFRLTSLSPFVLAEPNTNSKTTSLTGRWVDTCSSRISPAYGATAMITGRLVDAKGTNLYKGAVVDVQKLVGSDWVTIGQASRSCSGVYSFPVSAKSLTYFRFSFSGDPLNDASTSHEISLYPKVRLTLNDLKSSYDHRYSFTVRGTIAPAHTAGSTSVVSLRLYRWRHGEWRLYDGVRAVIGSNGTSYSASLRLPTHGKWKIVPIAWADAEHAETIGSAQYTKSK